MKPGDSAHWALRLPADCRTGLPHNCPWQVVLGDRPVLELYVSGVRPGTYTLTLTLPDGGVSQAEFTISALAAAAAVPSPSLVPPLAPSASPTAPQPFPTPTARASVTPRPPDRRVLPPGALSLAVDFPGPDKSQSESGVADASIAAGLTEVIVAANDVAAIYEKDGRLLHATQLPTLFRSLLSSNEWMGDARILFDPRSARYFLAAASTVRGPRCTPFSQCPNQWLLAVSKTSQPRQLTTDEWYLYTFDSRLEGGQITSTFGDFTVVSVDERTLIYSGQRITEAFEQHAKFWVFDKEPFLQGRPASPVKEFNRLLDPLTGQTLARALPATTFGEPGTLFLAERSSAGCGIVVLGVTGQGSSAQLTVRATPAGGRCFVAPPATQPGGTPLDVTSGHLTSPPVYRNGFLWLADVVRSDFASGPVSGVRVVQLDLRAWPAPPVVVTDAVFAQEGVWHHYPAIAVDARGNVAIAMTRSSSTEYPSIYYTGRLAEDPPQSFRPPVLLKNGVASKDCVSADSRTPRNRFADFSGAALDSSDGSAWLVGEYASSAERCAWGTWVGRVDWSVIASR